jgi:hypothetical protein
MIHLQGYTVEDKTPPHMQHVLTDAGVLRYNTQRGTWVRPNDTLVIDGVPAYWYEEVRRPTPAELGGLLFTIHHHHPRNEKIFFYEDDLLPILTACGLPEPKWGKTLKLEDYLKDKKGRLSKD